MNLPYGTSTAGDRALAQLQRSLEKFGCQNFGTMVDMEHGETVVVFKWRGKQVSLNASWKGYAEALRRAHRQISADRAIRQAKISVCSVLRDWVKGQITAVECGVLSFESAFLPYFLLDNGQRVIDRLQAGNGMQLLENQSTTAQT